MCNKGSLYNVRTSCLGRYVEFFSSSSNCTIQLEGRKANDALNSIFRFQLKNLSLKQQAQYTRAQEFARRTQADDPKVLLLGPANWL